MLIAVAVVLLAGAVLGAWFFRLRAPAAALALLGTVVGGCIGFFVGAADGPKGVPAASAVVSAVCLVAFGLVGLLATRARAPAASLRRSAIWVLAGGLVSAPIFAFALLLACPLYITGAGYCSYGGIDVLGGWASGVIALYTFDAIAIAALLLASTRRSVR